MTSVTNQPKQENQNNILPVQQAKKSSINFHMNRLAGGLIERGA